MLYLFKCRAVLNVCAVTLLLTITGCSPTSNESSDSSSEVGGIQNTLGREHLIIAINLPTELLGASSDVERLSGAIADRVENPVKIQRLSGNTGLIQAMAAEQIDIATLGAGSYASLYDLVADEVEPLLAFRTHTGDIGYYSAIMVKADSPYRTLEDLRGKRIGYVDHNSTSGFLYPRHALKQQGVNPDQFFGSAGITGGHIQSVIALESGQYDAVISLLNGGTPEHGFTGGIAQIMADREMIELQDYRYIWFAGPIPDTSYVIRTNLGNEFTDLVRGVLAALPYEDPAAQQAFGMRRNSTLMPVASDYYQSIIDMRATEISASH